MAEDPDETGGRALYRALADHEVAKQALLKRLGQRRVRVGEREGG